MTETEKTPLELTEQFAHVIELIGKAVPHEEEMEVGGRLVKMPMLDSNIPFASIIREDVEELLSKSRVTDSYKDYIRRAIEMRFSSPGVRFAETFWHGGSATPILHKCGIELEYYEREVELVEEPNPEDPLVTHKSIVSRWVPRPPSLGIFDPDINKLQILERDILRFALEQWGWGRDPEAMIKLQAWRDEFSTTYGGTPPVANQGNYEHSIIKWLWQQSQPL